MTRTRITRVIVVRRHSAIFTYDLCGAQLRRNHFPYPAPMSAKLLTIARDLQRRKARERQQLFVCEGVRATEELVRSPLVIRGVLVSPALAAAARGAELRNSVDA